MQAGRNIDGLLGLHSSHIGRFSLFEKYWDVMIASQPGTAIAHRVLKITTRNNSMHQKCSKVRPLVVTLALLTAPGLFFAQISAGYESSSSNRSSSEALSVPPNNSGRNVRDRGGEEAITPFSQSNNPSD